MLRPLLALALLATPALAQEEGRVLVQSTTSTANSGLYDHLLPIFTEATGLRVDVVAVGTGQAIRNAEACDGDLLLVHDRDAEIAFVEAGYGTERSDLMFNDFVLVGPEDDPAGIEGMADAQDALAAIAGAQAPFASRGDDSGTHRKELSLWEDTRADPQAASGAWYRETGSGMGATLNAAQGMGAYALTDRATWASFGNKAGMALLVEGDPDLHNQYGVVPVSPERCPEVNAAGARALEDWLLGPEGQAAIAGFRIDGAQVFFPNAS